MSEKVNLLELDPGATGAPLEVIRVGSDEVAIVPFTADGERLDVHYCDEAEIRGFVRCNGTGCVLCRIGRKAEPRILLPAYLAAAGVIGILMVSTTRTPHALLPQLLQSLRSGRREILFISRNSAKHTVTVRPLGEGEESGAAIIQSFVDSYAAGEIDLTSPIARISNEDIAEIPGIARHLALKGAA